MKRMKVARKVKLRPILLRFQTWLNWRMARPIWDTPYYQQHPDGKRVFLRHLEEWRDGSPRMARKRAKGMGTGRGRWRV